VSTALQNALAFASILGENRKVQDPTLEQVLAVTPHADPFEMEVAFTYVRDGRDAATALLARGPEGVAAIMADEDEPSWMASLILTETNDAEYRKVYFAVPGVHVRGAFYTFNLGYSPVSGLTLEGEHCNNSLAPKSSTEYQWQAEALAWQEANLDTARMIDPLDEDGTSPRWGWFCSNGLRDPSRRVADWHARQKGASADPQPVEHGMQPGRPVTVAAVAFVFRQGMGPNPRQTHQWAAEEADCDMVIHSEQKLLWAEVKGANTSISGDPTTWCACCGNSLGATGCGVCDYRYRDNQFDCSGGPPINPTAQALVEKFGWTFKSDPQIARDLYDESLPQEYVH